VLDVMLFFEKSVYQLYHMDMHGGNIILSENHIYIIDFELASWTLQERNGTPHRYRLNSVEHKYCGKEIILSGAYDVLFLLISCAVHKHKEIKDYCMTMIQSIYQLFWKDENVPFSVSIDMFTKKENRWLYYVLLEAETAVKKQVVHTHNVSQLNKMTVEWFLQHIFHDL